MASTNRTTTTRRKSAKRDIEEDDAPTAKRARTEVNGTGAKKVGGRVNGPTKKAAKTATYDEDDDGFQFARRTTRRTAAKSSVAPEPKPEEPARLPPSRKKKTSIAPPEPAHAEPTRKRRSARLSGDNALPENPSPPTAKPLPKRTKKAPMVEKKQPEQHAEEPVDKENKVAHVGVQTPKQNELHIVKQATKIMLPFADTPVITRNKEMRKGNKDGHRRSSTGLRGRRASSLIDSGLSNALPHSEVDVREFYKYIEQSLPEPRRMKQLLTWCGSRALPNKPSGDVKDASAIMAARAIQQELIDDFAGKSEMSDWFSREETTPASVIKKPNPQNIKNEASIQELEEEIKRLEEEKAAWEALSLSSRQLSEPAPPTWEPSLSSIDPSLLDPTQASILSALQKQPSSASTEDPAQPHPPCGPFTFTFTSPAALQSRLTSLSQSLESNIDLLADGIHKMEQYRNTAERAADRVLSAAARTLEERERAVRESVGSEGIGVRDVLRGLARVLGEGGR
ncbi:hypothetical protein GQ43DRAFT_442279 [Delitschia confertaspora ATCC 74209]|uniref:Uncharacterized protein n=1 Tax=Delitschia confertaspora ATCC 74209 TaxID=1513339 RepID=A0A9P4JHT8_9PLEO|nr:hypothetical protein GQ43DRAFT_442279 [Delitschia confertaspora ATCC 74209]